jgi:hypothetical protein
MKSEAPPMVSCNVYSFSYPIHLSLAKFNRFIRPKNDNKRSTQEKARQEETNELNKNGKLKQIRKVKGERLSRTDPFQKQVAHRDAEKPKDSTDWRQKRSA